MRCGKLLAFVAGTLVGLTLSLGGLVVAATALEVDMVPLKFFVDGADRTPSGGVYHNGSTTVPVGFVYEETTYVPLRFVSELVGREVGWREQDNSIWIGSQWPGRFAWYTDLKPADFLSNWQEQWCAKEDWNNMADAWNNVWNHGYSLTCERWSYGTETIRLDGRFKQFTGTLTLHPDAKSKNPDNLAPFLKIYVDDEARYISPRLKPTSKHVPISVDLTGATTMRFEWEYGNERHSNNTPIGLVDMKFFYQD
ncbi:MAG TPA: stalk domain-containing protein [Symbiobacteriaceae bacterium]|nr:stalk domain-containing protein [Symbiobacteriaceae bacterium]